MMKREKKSWLKWKVGERGSVVDNEAGNVHNPVAGHCVFAGAVVEQSDVVKKKKILRQPADDVH